MRCTPPAMTAQKLKCQGAGMKGSQRGSGRLVVEISHQEDDRRIGRVARFQFGRAERRLPEATGRAAGLRVLGVGIAALITELGTQVQVDQHEGNAADVRLHQQRTAWGLERVQGLVAAVLTIEQAL